MAKSNVCSCGTPDDPLPLVLVLDVADGGENGVVPTGPIGDMRDLDVARTAPYPAFSGIWLAGTLSPLAACSDEADVVVLGIDGGNATSVLVPGNS